MSKVYSIITDKIVSLLEEGTVPWKKPWKGAALTPKNLSSGREYRGINLFLLSAAPYDSPWWLTFKQAQHRGGRVRKGERGFPCVYWNWREKIDKVSGEKKNVPFIRYYTVFNSEQTEGVDVPPLPQPRADFSPIEECQAVVEAFPPTRSEIQLGGNAAFYRPPVDQIGMPKPERFDSPEEYYATLFHELTHSTGHSSRLDRAEVMKASFFGSGDYSREELVAEMGASYLAGHTGIEASTVNNAAAYISSWLKRLKEDKRLVVQAASRAQKAADFILNRKYEGLEEKIERSKDNRQVHSKE